MSKKEHLPVPYRSLFTFLSNFKKATALSLFLPVSAFAAGGGSFGYVQKNLYDDKNGNKYTGASYEMGIFANVNEDFTAVIMMDTKNYAEFGALYNLPWEGKITSTLYASYAQYDYRNFGMGPLADILPQQEEVLFIFNNKWRITDNASIDFAYQHRHGLDDDKDGPDFNKFWIKPSYYISPLKTVVSYKYAVKYTDGVSKYDEDEALTISYAGFETFNPYIQYKHFHNDRRADDLFVGMSINF